MPNPYVNKVVQSDGTTLIDISDTTAEVDDVVSGKSFYLASGEKAVGTRSGVDANTTHTIYFEFSDDSDATLTGYWNDAFISDAITATTPTEYGGKTVQEASLDGTTWYVKPSETWETLFDGDVRWTHEDHGDYPYCWIMELGSIPITVGSVWRVTYNNTEYRCTGKAVSIAGQTYNLFGNPLWFGGTDDGSNVPFAFNAYTTYGAWSGNLNVPNVDSNYYFKIERLVA